MNAISWLGVIVGCTFLLIIILCYIRHLLVFGVDLPCSTLKTDYFGRPYPEAAAAAAKNAKDVEDPDQFDPDEAARGESSSQFTLKGFQTSTTKGLVN